MAENILHCDFTNTLTDVKRDFRLKLQGSEAKLYFGTFLGRPAVLKERFVKKYRHHELDKNLSTERMKFEARAMAKCHDINVLCPALYLVDLKERFLVMEEIDCSITVRDFLRNLDNCSMLEKDKTLSSLANAIGTSIATMHLSDVMHGDLTTSNMLLKKELLTDGIIELYLIDFGLSKKGGTVEDKAVDMYVLERALLSTHPEAESLNHAILTSYFNNLGKNKEAIERKLEEVRLRGRKRSMVG